MNKISDKTEFVLAFAALIIGLGIFSSELKQININFGFKSFSLWDIGLTILLLLLLSIYLYALDYVRYGIPRIENWKVFKTLQRIAHFLYLFAIILPLLIVLIWPIAFLLSKLPITNIQNYVSYIATISSVLISIVAFFLSLLQLKRREKVIQEEISERASRSLLETDRLVEKRKWRLVVIETFRLLELMFKNKAEEIGINASRLPFVRLVRIFVEKELITKTQAAKLDQVRELRNLAAHSEKVISRQQAAYVTDVVNEIGNILTPVSFASGFLEEKVLGVLSKLFPKHHIFHQFNVGKGERIDFMAEGPDHTYFIEIKMVDSPALIRRASRQIQALLKRDSDRGLLVLPLTAMSADIADSRIKILYFDIQNERFSNQQEIYKWIYG